MALDGSDIDLGAEVILPSGLPHGVGCQIGHRAVVGGGCSLGDRVQIGPNATVLPPRSTASGRALQLQIHDDVTIGAAAVICGASVIGVGALVEAGSVVSVDVPPYAVVSGNPAQVVGYRSPASSERTSGVATEVSAPEAVGSYPLLGEATLIRFPTVTDLRGKLTFGEIDDLLPFRVDRFFFVYGVPSEAVRGEHAHRSVHELLIGASGSLRVSLTDGKSRCEVTLDTPNVGLHIAPGIWATQYRFDRAAVLLVLCSHKYDPASYIRNFDEFLAEPR